MPVKDFLCPRCRQAYQLKSQKTPFGNQVTDAAYSKFISAVENDTAPNLVLMHYDRLHLRVVDVDIIPRFFLSSSCIVPRKPLSSHAKRAHWVGCVISLERLPSDARISIVRNERIEEPNRVQERYRRFASLMLGKTSQDRGWTADVLRYVRAIRRPDFDLRDLYAFEKELRGLHPNNRFIQAKIRQQLQLLRDQGVLRFLGNGHYELLEAD
jgi:type II restriction enzyme